MRRWLYQSIPAPSEGVTGCRGTAVAHIFSTDVQVIAALAVAHA